MGFFFVTFTQLQMILASIGMNYFGFNMIPATIGHEL
jgi:hypothetical protein